jgi:TonB-linked SusC/RagA family outer membrane protein
MKQKMLCRLLCGMLLLMGFLAQAQNANINGTVTDEKGAAISGASIRLKSTKKGTVSGDDGSFTLQANTGQSLLVSAIGFLEKEVVITASNNLTIALVKSTNELDQVVVTALGVKRSKRNLTYSTQELKGGELTATKETNLVNSMAGKVSGVQITSSTGTAGGSSRIVIRGASSPTGDNQALFVVDGVPINNDETGNIGGGAAGAGSNRVADIDPSIIESINVLKGAAATALYGSAGAKGVIIITTKSGALDKKPTLSFSSDLSFESPLLPERQSKYAQGSNGIYFNGEDQKTSASWGPLMDTLKIDGKPAPKYDPWKSFLRQGITTNNTVSVNGGGTNSSYYLSYSYLDQQGFMPVNDFKRHSIFAKYTTKIYKNLTATLQIEYSNSNQTRLPEGASNGPLFVLMGQPVSWNPEPAVNADGTQRLFRFSRNPPLWTIDNIKNASVVNRYIPVFTVNYTPTSWLTITERAGADMYGEQDKYTESPSPAIGLKGQIRDQNINFRQFNSDLIINAHKQFNKFDVNFLLGNNIYTNYNQYYNLTATGLTINDYNNVAAGGTLSGSEAHYQQRKVGFYAQANIEYNRILALSLTGRYDGSSVLSTEKNFYPYGSAAASFIFSELFPASLSKAISFGKLRFSYATVGNDGVGAYALGTPYLLAGRNTNAGYFPFPYQDQPGFLLSQTLGNANLQNERLNEYEGGLEMKFLNNRIGFEASYFYRKSINGIIPGVSISNATGYSGTTVNTASIENKGFELLVNATPIKNKNFSWDMTLNFTSIRNKVLALYPGLNQLGRLIVGQPYNIFYGARYERNAAGQLLIDATGSPVVASTQGIVGNANPDWLAGLSNSFTYKQFSLGFFFDMKKGGDVQNDVDSYGNFYGTTKATENREPLVVEGISVVDNKPNTVAINAQTYYQSRQYESLIQDGTYIKLRNASLSYNVKPGALAKTPFKAASLTVTGRNLWIYSPHFTGADPEVSSYGTANGNQSIYAFSTPTSRSVNFSLKLVF